MRKKGGKEEEEREEEEEARPSLIQHPVGQALADKSRSARLGPTGGHVTPKGLSAAGVARHAKQSAGVQPTGTFRPNSGRRGLVGPNLAEAVLFL